MARKILLADDSVTAQNMGRKILADAGYEVIAVNNGSAALKKIAELKPDLVILDVYMPGYSGLEVCQRLKESQETARIPVLLSVGKLEPFKPEEAQRVRADGFIVKPFEASELLSALSKLEDKVVPRAEPSKPGRFARAMAAADEADRGGRSADDNGWKSRIGFPPKKKTEPEEKVADEAALYNPVNRDLRTVVEKPGAEKEKTRQPAAEPAGTSVDVAAMVPSGLPQDVTPEEVAAIAAAVAQMQMAGAAGKDGENQVSAIEASEIKIPETKIYEEKNEASFAVEPGPVENNLPVPAGVSYGSETPEHMEARGEGKIDDRAGEAAVTQTTAATPAEPENDVPVTMAATAEAVVAASTGASSWMAVSVALDSEEAAISLDHEMRKAYAAFAAAEADSAGAATAPEVQAAQAENSSPQAEATVEVPVATISSPEPEPVPEPTPAMSVEASDAGAAAVAQAETAAVAASFVDVPTVSEPTGASSEQTGDAVPESRTAEVAPLEQNTGISPAAQLAEPHQEPAPPTEVVSAAVETEVAGSGALAAETLPPAPEVEPAMAEANTDSSVALAPIGRREEHDSGRFEEPRLDPETVKSTAAAWASWRQIRDSGEAKADTVAETKPSEFEVPGSAPADSAAMAVAAGAEQILQEASVAPGDQPQDVASIVDSVLADLRPKLMAEISRKMAEKK